jgi:DNA helicase-2/ATP-dependent DNA helicase PcrA
VPSNVPLKSLTDLEQDIVREELLIQSKIFNAIDLERQRQNLEEIHRRHRILNLRDETKGAIKSDLASLYEQMHNQGNLADRQSRAQLPSLESPYFARMELQENGKIKNVLVGFTSFLSSALNYPIVDWRVAPVAKIFFKYRQGQEYQEELPGRIAEGIVTKRHILTIHNGKLIEILGQEYHFKCDDAGVWYRNDNREQNHFSGGQKMALRTSNFGTGLSTKTSPQLAGLLDQEQYAVITSNPFQPLLVLGGAGSGKTTVALHRLAALHGKDSKYFSPEQTIVIVPELGIARLSKILLRSIHMDKVEVMTFDQWVCFHGQRVFAGLPRRICEETPSRVIAFKRHPAILSVIDHFVAKIVFRFEAMIRQHFLDIAKDDRWFEFQGTTSVASWLTSVEKHIAGAYEKNHVDREKKIRKFFGELRYQLVDMNSRREELFKDEDVLRHAMAAFKGEISEEMIIAVKQHTQNQFAEIDSDLDAIDTDRKTAVDGHDLDWRTPDDIIGTIDNEDFAILFHLLHRFTGEVRTNKGTLPTYHHLILDEAQELAGVELAVIGHCIQHPPSLTICGDSAQHVDSNAAFEDWERSIKYLGLTDISSAHLKTNYRSTLPIAEYSLGILGSLAKDPPIAQRDGAPVKISYLKSFGLGIVLMVDELTGLIEREPFASIAMIARTPAAAMRFHQGLDEMIDARLILNGEFSFSPGIDITHVEVVKGLEFDYVIIPDADTHTYYDDHYSRRALHVACTRAIHQLWIISTSSPASILPKPIKS